MCILVLISPLLAEYQPISSFASSLLLQGTSPDGIASNRFFPRTIISASSQSDFVSFANKTVPSVGQASLVDEPSVANKGPIVFYTGNHYAARSSDGGFSWSSVDPFGDMSDFCCDQDVIYVPSRSLFIWERMGDPGTVGVNHIRLVVPPDATS